MKKPGKLAILACVALFLVALWASIGRPRQGRTARGVALTPVVYLVGHRTAVSWGGNCTDCHATRMTGAPRPAMSPSKVHLSILKAAKPRRLSRPSIISPSAPVVGAKVP